MDSIKGVSTTANTRDVAIVGGGIIGLAIAWRASALGMSVTVLERGQMGSGASHVAAGMLAPVAEAEFGDDAKQLLDMGVRSLSLWPEFAEELSGASDVEVRVHETGTLVLARDGDEARELERQLALRDSLALPTRRLLPSQARELEPALAPTVRLAMEAADDHSIDPRVVVEALQLACRRGGVDLREHTEVASLHVEGKGAEEASPGAKACHSGGPIHNGEASHSNGRRAAGVRLRGGELVRAETVVIAAGAWSPQIGGLPDDPGTRVRPVKGQILRLLDPSGPGLLSRSIRYESGYIVPRGDGRYVLGGTVEEQGFDSSPTAGGLHWLLREAFELVPGISELQIQEISVGFRPGTPDNVPVIGRGSLDGLLWATGHYRNGILLTPVTAELALDALAGQVAA